MRISTLPSALALVATLCALSPAAVAAHEYKAGGLVLHHPWTRATPAGARIAGGYVVIENTGATADTLVGGSLARATGFEIHRMANVDGVMTMRPVEGGLPIPAGGTVTFEPNGLHLMFPGLGAQLKQGERVGGTLVFEKAGTVAVDFAVDAIAAKGDEHVHTQ